MRRICGLLVGLALGLTSVSAQVATPTVSSNCGTSIPPDEAADKDFKARIKSLETAYFSGDEKATRERAKAVLVALPSPSSWKCSPESAETWRTGPVSIVLRSTGRIPTGEVVRFWAHRPYGGHVPGLVQFWEVFLTTDPDVQLASTYSSTRKADPVVAKIPELVKSFDLAALERADFRDGLQLFNQRSKVREKGQAIISSVNVPHRRGTLTIKDKATTIPDVCPKKIDDWTAVAALAVREGGASECSRRVFEAIVSTATAKCTDMEFLKKPIAAQRKEIKKATSGTATAAFTTCDRDPDQLDPAIATEEKLGSILVGSTKSAEGTSTYENVPLRRVGLATIAALVGASDDDDRVALSSNSLVADPIDDPLYAIGLNIHPKKYDPSSPKPTPAERWRIVVGATFKPEFGVIVGGGYGLVRGLSINAGVGWLSVNTLRDGDALGSAPTDSANPFDRDFTSIAFLGFGYNF